MTDKYKVIQAVMDELHVLHGGPKFYQTIWNLLEDLRQIDSYPDLHKWIYDSPKLLVARREQAVIDYVFNGADNFEVKTTTWVIVSKEADDDGDWHHLITENNSSIDAWIRDFWSHRDFAINTATRITDPKLKDALLYANKDFEAIEVEE